MQLPPNSVSCQLTGPGGTGEVIKPNLNPNIAFRSWKRGQGGKLTGAPGIPVSVTGLLVIRRSPTGSKWMFGRGIRRPGLVGAQRVRGDV